MLEKAFTAFYCVFVLKINKIKIIFYGWYFPEK